MNFTECTEDLIQIVRHQEDANGFVTRTSFLSSVSLSILHSYEQQLNKERELQLRQSLEVNMGSPEGQSTYKYLSILFDALDFTQSMRLPSTELISLLGLLSKTNIKYRFRYFITSNGQAVGDMIYLSTLTTAFDGFFLLVDMLMPTVNSQEQVHSRPLFLHM